MRIYGEEEIEIGIEGKEKGRNKDRGEREI